MEPGQHQQQEPKQQQQHEDSSSSRSGFLCRQSSTRWIPTADQIRILKDIYYNNGITSPNADQIQKISARLRQYGKIEGKNVFYWFQNHKARERQKKKFSLDVAMQRSCCKPYDDSSSSSSCSLPNKYTTTMGGFSPSLPPPISSLSSPVVFPSGQMENIGCGSLLMEKSFRECSISGSGDGWMGVVPSCSSYAGKYTYSETLEGEAPLMETLPLFPMHGQEDHGDDDDDDDDQQEQQEGKADKKKQEDCFPGFYGTAKAAETTLELSLSSNYYYYYQGSLDHNST